MQLLESNPDLCPKVEEVATGRAADPRKTYWGRDRECPLLSYNAQKYENLRFGDHKVTEQKINKMIDLESLHHTFQIWRQTINVPIIHVGQ